MSEEETTATPTQQGPEKEFIITQSKLLALMQFFQEHPLAWKVSNNYVQMLASCPEKPTGNRSTRRAAASSKNGRKKARA